MSVARRDWIRLRSAWWTDPDHSGLSFGAKAFGPFLFWIADGDPTWRVTGRGRLLGASGAALGLQHVCSMAGARLREVRRWVGELVDVGTLRIDDSGAYYFPNYRKHQEDPSASRKRRQRDSHGTVTGKVTGDVTGEVEVEAEVEVEQNLTHTPRGGAELARLIDLVDVVEFDDTAASARTAIEAAIKSGGFDVERRVPAPTSARPDGRIEIVAESEGVRIGIELDRKSPRQSSIDKLRGFPGESLIIVRTQWGLPPPQGISAVVGIPPKRRRAKANASDPSDDEQTAIVSVLEHLNATVAQLNPKSTGYAASKTNSEHILKRLRDGTSVAVLLAVIDAKAKEVRNKPESIQWLNPATPFRDKNWANSLGSVNASRSPSRRGPVDPSTQDHEAEVPF